VAVAHGSRARRCGFRRCGLAPWAWAARARGRVRPALRLAGFALLVVGWTAAARKAAAKIYARAIDIMLAVDVSVACSRRISPSTANAPHRVARSVGGAEFIDGRRVIGRGSCWFAARPYTQCPLTWITAGWSRS